MDLENWRTEINELDKQLLDLLNRRAAVALKVGESKMPDGVDKVELAAMTATANVLLNLNETITK